MAYLLVVLKEVANYDWKFPPERNRIAGQLQYLAELQREELATLLAGFSSLDVGSALRRSLWAANPGAAVEEMTAWLWSSHQMDAFRVAAEKLSNALAAAVPAREPSQPRLGMVVMGQGAEQSSIPLFRKLRPHGVHLTRVDPRDGVSLLVAEAQRRANKFSSGGSAPSGPGHSDTLLHWYIDGGTSVSCAGLTQISYSAVDPMRTALLERTQQEIRSGGAGPESLRTLLAQLKPSDLEPASSLSTPQGNPVLQRFELSLLTEGSGTQIFSTTFVQWAARECLRRAEPETLLLRYAPRQRMQPMNSMLSAKSEASPDPQGSIIDADMGAYYTWLNMQRLSGARNMRFLAWYENHSEALVIGPDLPVGTSSDSPMNIGGVMKLLE